MSKLQWKPYNIGSCGNLVLYDRKGIPFSGTPEDFEILHGSLRGQINVNTGEVLLINQYFDIVGVGTRK